MFDVHQSWGRVLDSRELLKRSARLLERGFAAALRIFGGIRSGPEALASCRLRGASGHLLLLLLSSASLEIQLHQALGYHWDLPD